MKGTVDTVTLVIFLAMWPIFLIWEVVLFAMRGASPSDMPGLISMVVRDHGWNLTCLVYLWIGLAAHFWWNTDKGSGLAGTIVFWVIPVALLVWDITLWRSNPAEWSVWLRWARWPGTWAILSALSGRFLFPQVGSVPWR